VRTVLAKFSVRQIEAASETSLERVRNATAAGDRASADIFRRVADECSRELEDRLLALAAKSVVNESGRADRQAREFASRLRG
jgi:hypothetical protein